MYYSDTSSNRDLINSLEIKAWNKLFYMLDSFFLNGKYI